MEKEGKETYSFPQSDYVLELNDHRHNVRICDSP